MGSKKLASLVEKFQRRDAEARSRREIGNNGSKVIDETFESIDKERNIEVYQ